MIPFLYLKLLFDNFKNFPIVGTPIKVAYVGHLVKGVVADGKQSSSAKDLKGLSGDEFEKAVDKEANDIFDEYIMPEIQDCNIPQQALDVAKEKAVEKIAEKIRETVFNSFSFETGLIR